MGSGYFYSRKCLKVIWEGADCSLKGEKTRWQEEFWGWTLKRKRWTQSVNPAGRTGSGQAEPGEIRLLASGLPGVCHGAALATSDTHRGFPQKLSWGCKFKQIFKNIYG